jgi:glycosyltransferase involved in cell wall biosynthesis
MNYYMHIDRTKYQFDFFVENTSRLINKDKIRKMGGRVFIIPHYLNVFKYMKVLRKYFEKGKYDIVHSNMNSLSVFTLKAAKKAGVPIRIAHSHSTSNKRECKRDFIKNLLRPFSRKYATHYFACSENAGRWLFGNKTFDEGKVTVINNAIDLERFKFSPKWREEIRAQYDVDDKFVVGTVGRFVTQKNQLFLIDIFNEYLKINPDAALLLVGDGPLHNKLRDKVKKYALGDRVIFAGVHKHTERYFAAMDCFVFPSLYEGFGMTFLEAQVGGLKCVGSTMVPSEAAIKDHAIRLPLNAPIDEWASSIESTKCETRATAYEGFVGSKYDISVEAAKLETLYDGFLANISTVKAKKGKK